MRKKPQKKEFKKHPTGCFHIDITEIATQEEKSQIFVAINRSTKLTYAQSYKNKENATTANFLRELITFVPCQIHMILTDNGIQFTNRTKDKYAFIHIFDRIMFTT